MAKQLFNKASYQDRQNTERIPFVQLMGYEKTYGKPQPQDYAALVQRYTSWAYACAWKNATSVAKCNICLYAPSYDNKKEKEEKKKILKHPFLDLIKSVNPHSNRFELMTVTGLNLELTGNAYWYMPRGVLGIPEMIWNIPSHWVKVVPSQENFIDGYVVTVPGKPLPIPFDERDIVHFKYPSPTDLFYGSGPAWAAAVGLDLNAQIKEWGVNYFLNNAQPSGILTTESSLSPDQYKRLKDQWNEKYRGAKNAGKMAFLENGLKYQQMGSNIRDARFEMVSADIRNEIMAIFGVPASKLGLEAHDNRATAEASDYTYQNETILPRLTLIQEKINEKIIPVYDPRLIMEFDNPVGEDKEFLLKERQINLQTGFSSIDELRMEQGLDAYDLPETKVPLIPFGLNPAGTPKPEPTEMMPIKSKGQGKWEQFAKLTRPQEKLMQETMRRYFQKQHGEVMRKLNGSKAVTKDLFGSIIFNINEANSDLKNRTRSHVDKSYRMGFELGSKETGLDFTLFNPNVSRAVEQRVGFFAERVNESTSKLLKEALDAGFLAGESISDIAKRVDKVFNYSEDFRSVRTAQTEVIGATNDGQLRSYMEAGVKEKEWITAQDENVRYSHQINGQVVEIHQSFTTREGNKLQYPGDRSGVAPAGEIINCRCTVLPVIKI